MVGSFFDWFLRNKEAFIAQEKSVLDVMIYRSCAYKAKIVGMDEKEQGVRAHLNFGHTFGHAIETHMGYGSWLHGEAVAVGMVLASRLSYLEGLIDEQDCQFLQNLLQTFDLPTLAPAMTTQTWLDLMGHDKKVKAGKLRFVLLQDLGQAVVTDTFNQESLYAVLSGQ